MPDTHWLAEFVREHTYYVAGELMPFGDFEAAFFDFLRPREPHKWTRRRLVRALNSIGGGFCYGVHNSNRKYVANMAWEYRRSTLRPIYRRNGRLRRPR